MKNTSDGCGITCIHLKCGALKRKTFALLSQPKENQGERLKIAVWWAHEDSNLGQSGDEQEALPTEL